MKALDGRAVIDVWFHWRWIESHDGGATWDKLEEMDARRIA